MPPARICLGPQFAHLYAPVRRSSLAVMSVVTEISNARGGATMTTATGGGFPRSPHRRGAHRDRARDARVGMVEHGSAGWRPRGPVRRGQQRQARWRSRTVRRRSILRSSPSGAGRVTKWSSLAQLRRRCEHRDPGRGDTCVLRRPRVAGPEPRSRRSRGGDRAADEGCRPSSLRGLRLRSPGCPRRRRAARRLGDRGRSTRSRRKPRRPCSGNVRRSRLFQLLLEQEPSSR